MTTKMNGAGWTSCPTKKCPKLVSPRSQFRHCQNCRAGQRYWSPRPVSAILGYRDKLEMRNARLDYVLDDHNKKLPVKTTGLKKEVRHAAR